MHHFTVPAVCRLRAYHVMGVHRLDEVGHLVNPALHLQAWKKLFACACQAVCYSSLNLLSKQTILRMHRHCIRRASSCLLRASRGEARLVEHVPGQDGGVIAVGPPVVGVDPAAQGYGF